MEMENKKTYGAKGRVRGMEFHPCEENPNCETEKGLPSDLYSHEWDVGTREETTTYHFSFYRTWGRQSQWSGSRFKTTAAKNFALWSVIKLLGLLWHSTMELKAQMFLNRDYMKEWTITSGIKHNNFIFSAHLLLARAVRRDTLDVPCSNAPLIITSLILIFLLRCEKERSNRFLGMEAYICLFPCPERKIIVVPYLPVWEFFHAPEENAFPVVL